MRRRGYDFLEHFLIDFFNLVGKFQVPLVSEPSQDFLLVANVTCNSVTKFVLLYVRLFQYQSLFLSKLTPLIIIISHTFVDERILVTEEGQSRETGDSKAFRQIHLFGGD